MSVRIVKHPSVFLVGSTQLFDDTMQDFFDHERISPDPDVVATEDNCSVDLMPELGGRICYMSYEKPRPGGNKAYLANILAINHGSVLEHTTFNFIVSDVSRSLTHELVRHRVGVAYSQLSQRYVEHDGVFVMPWEIQQLREQDQVNWINLMIKIYDEYGTLVQVLEDALDDTGLNRTERRKSARQAARSVLPSATATKLLFTVNARELRHIFNLRGSVHADKEIRMLAVALFDKVSTLNVFQDISVDSSITPSGLKFNGV